ncbi:uncharacterized protein LOC110008262 [Amborella trichopoda]|uniref:uncharacterized protein LOC110008262 n=1 Tax=Amborella trichopoda TaxID=13333 RepID=UPI0009C13A64|nr:uncharacterized protein LOC110008262 [Amborella trichopoda]|eukprot:XP_020530404.1 uncharacterized protein LOC110008262 [Amborella trichopoda]
MLKRFDFRLAFFLPLATFDNLVVLCYCALRGILCFCALRGIKQMASDRVFCVSEDKFIWNNFKGGAMAIFLFYLFFEKFVVKLLALLTLKKKDTGCMPLYRLVC